MKFPFLSGELCVVKSISPNDSTRNTVDFVAYDGTHGLWCPSTSTRNVTESLLPVATLRSDQSSVHSSDSPSRDLPRGGAHVLYASRPSMSA